MTDDDHYTKLVTRHPDPAEAVARHEQAIEAMRSFADDARDVQPEGNA